MHIPFSARHADHSVIASADDDVGPDDFLMDLSLQAIQLARTASVVRASSRMTSTPRYPDVWPGEHYKLLAGLVRAMKPRHVVEIGTAGGMSALSMLPYLPRDGRLTTFDITPWQDFGTTAQINQGDFEDARLKQIIGDLADDETFDAHRDLLIGADFIFMDGPKDNRFEWRFINKLGSLKFDVPPVVVMDDTRTWNMLKVWREIKRPKLDLTSFGHWSGTGIVHWV